MDLIERYLTTVGWDLPRDQRADITEELRDLLQSQVEEREAALGRPLERKELEQLLIDFGHPLVVAGRYRKVQQLIGPEVFPFWWAAIRVVLTIVAAIYLVLMVATAVGLGDDSVVGRMSPGLGWVLVYIFGVVTLVFAAIERFGGTKVLTRWKPRDLPPPNFKPRSRFEKMVEIGMGGVFLLWWAGVVQFRDLAPFPQAVTVEMAPIWAIWFWPILAYAAAEIIINLVALLRPAWARLNATLSLLRNLVGALILGRILQAGHFVEVGGTSLSAHARQVMQVNFDLGMKIGLSVTVMVLVIKAGIDAWRLYQASGGRGGDALLRTGRAPG